MDTRQSINMYPSYRWSTLHALQCIVTKLEVNPGHRTSHKALELRLPFVASPSEVPSHVGRVSLTEDFFVCSVAERMLHRGKVTMCLPGTLESLDQLFARAQTLFFGLFKAVFSSLCFLRCDDQKSSGESNRHNLYNPI